jgi:ethanolamine transporter EutH
MVDDIGALFVTGIIVSTVCFIILLVLIWYNLVLINHLKMEGNILSKELAFILMSSVVITPLAIGLWYITKKALRDYKELKHSN